MQRRFTILITSVLVASLFPSPAHSQTHTFATKDVDYVIDFPSAKWRPLPSSGIVSARTRTEFKYADSNSVRLLVRRKIVDAHVTPSDMVRRRHQWDRHLAGYVLIKEETFTGQLSGHKFAYEYSRGGKTTTALIYYLEADNRTIYSLLFTANSDEVQVLYDQADSIARSFHFKDSPRSAALNKR